MATSTPAQKQTAPKAQKTRKPQKPHPCREWFDEYYQEQRICAPGDDWTAFKRALEEGGRGAPDLRVDVEIFERETHGSMSYPFACRALDWLAADLEERGLCNIGIGPS